jgi:hypothetical protein
MNSWTCVNDFAVTKLQCLRIRDPMNPPHPPTKRHDVAMNVSTRKTECTCLSSCTSFQCQGRSLSEHHHTLLTRSRLAPEVGIHDYSPVYCCIHVAYSLYPITDAHLALAPLKRYMSISVWHQRQQQRHFVIHKHFVTTI